MNKRSTGDMPIRAVDAPPAQAEGHGPDEAARATGAASSDITAPSENTAPSDITAPSEDTAPSENTAPSEDTAPSENTALSANTGRIVRVLLSEDDNDRRPSILARDVDQAMAELAGENSFQPRGLTGPFVLRLALENGRLLFDIRDAGEGPLALLGLAIGPFRRLMKDYLMIVDSHAAAAAIGHVSRMEAIDMGRRGLHNEGAELIIQRLAGKIDVDFETARRLFTLVCVLHQRP